MTSSETPSSPWAHIVRNTALVAGSFGLAAVMGLIRNMVIAEQFGIGAELDTFYAAFKLPDLLFTVVAGGALATAFIPVFAEVLSQDGRQSAWRLASAVTNLVMLVVIAFAGLVWLFAPTIIGTLIAPGFDAAQQAETASLMRVVLLATILFGISSVQSAVLHGFKHFLWPALAPAAYPLGIIAGALWLTPTMGITGLAWGAVIGAALHLAIKLPVLLAYGFTWRPILDLDRPTLHRVLVLMGPRVLDLGVFHLTLIVTTNLASRLGEGSVSALEWGWDAMQLPETIIGTAFGLVAFPTLADLAARNNLLGLQKTLNQTLQAVLALTIPAAVGLVMLGQPILSLLYQRGAFDESATQAVYIALCFYVLGLAGHSCLELVARTFFAQQDTLTPLWVAAASAMVNIGLALGLMNVIGHGGLALANSIAVTAEVMLLIYLLRRRWGRFDIMPLLKTSARVLLATAVMAGAVWAVQVVGAQIGLSTLLIVLGGVSVGGLVYLSVGYFVFGVSYRVFEA